ncbi:MAG: alpha/beta hydrolase [Clostridiales bacterium]|nr:alpha/beta hydrolase [Clostridiales bacterium]
MVRVSEKALAQAEEAAKFFIQNCQEFDTPRLESETYPEEAEVLADQPYIDDGNTDHMLDLYVPENPKAGEIFLLIHGGAFVYGSKELDKCFGMHLAIRSGVTVANINYQLMPKVALRDQLEDIFSAITYLNKKGYSVFHTTGDSAGGYLCVLTAILINSEEARKECGITDFHLNVTCKSTSPICGAPYASPKRFAGIFFDREGSMPSYIYNLTDAVTRHGCPPIVITTGDKDMMRRFDLHFFKKIRKTNIPVKYYCADSADDRVMHHVYAIAHPTWPEGIKTIDMTIENAKGNSHD